MDINNTTIYISLAAIAISALSAVYSRRQASQALWQRILLQYDPLTKLMQSVDQVCEKIDEAATEQELEEIRKSFVESIRRSRLFLPTKIYGDFHALLTPFHEAIDEKWRFITTGIGRPVPGKVLRPKAKFDVLETEIRSINYVIARKIWKL